MIHLGLTSREYGSMTLRQLSVLWEAWRQRERILDRRAALMPWLYAESNRNQEKNIRPWILEDFMPGEPGPQKPVSEAMAVAHQDAHMVGFSYAMGLKTKTLSAEEYAAILASRYTEPNG